MPIATRRPARRHVRRTDRKPPTQSQLSEACYSLVEHLLGRRATDQRIHNAANALYCFAEKSVSTAWGVVGAARTAARIKDERNNLRTFGPLQHALQHGRQEDLAQKKELIAELKAEETNDERKAEIEKVLKDLLLRNIPQGKPLKRGPKATQYIVATVFNIMKIKRGSQLEAQLHEEVLEHFRLYEFIALKRCSDDEKAQYEELKAQDKADRMQAQADAEAENTQSEVTAAAS